MTGGIDRRAMATLSGGHLATDFASGAVPALLPFLAREFDLSYTRTALLMLSVTVSSSLIQPLFGLWSDRRGAMWLMPAGVALAGVGVGLAAVAPAYWLVAVLVFVSGIGVAAYHPEGAKFASYASGHRRASGMSLFNIGGNTGYALGPIVVTPLVVWLGLEGGLLAAAIPLVAAVAILRTLPRLARIVPEGRARLATLGRDRPGAMAVLGLVIVLRTVAWFTLLTFVPLWVVSRGHSEADGNHVLALMLVSGAVGTLVLGPVADRVGLRRTLTVTQALLPFLIVAFVVVGGVVGVLALMLVGAFVVGTFGVTMVLSHLYVPRHLGVASGLAVGLAMGLGGVAAVAFGALADAVDLRTALLASAAAPALGVVLCLLLPAPGVPGRAASEPVPSGTLVTD